MLDYDRQAENIEIMLQDGKLTREEYNDQLRELREDQRAAATDEAAEAAGQAYGDMMGEGW